MSMLPPDPVYVFVKDMQPISCIAFEINNMNKRIFVGTRIGKVHVWRISTLREESTFQAGTDNCLSILIPENSQNLVITQCKTGAIAFWRESINEWSLVKFIEIDFFGFCKCDLFEGLLYAPLKDSKCELISVKEMETQDKIDLNEDKCGDIMTLKVFSMDDNVFVIVGYEGLKLGLWDLSGKKKLSFLTVDDCPMALDYDVKTNKGVCGNPSDKMLVFSVDKSLELKKEREISLTSSGVAAVKIRPDAKLVAAGCWDGKVRLYSWKSLVLLAALDAHTETVQDVCFSSAMMGSKKFLLAAASEDQKFSLWDLYN